jgi:thymidylate synthase (FAD)
MRGSEHAEVEIRRAAFESYRCLYKLAPILFGDFEVEHLSDGTHGLKTPFPKV